MSKRQVIIAWMLSVVSFIGLAANIYFLFIGKIDTDGTNRLMNVLFCGIGLALSLPSVIRQNTITRAIQVLSICMAGAFCFTGGVGGAPFGAIIFIFAIKAAESYGFYKSEYIPKIISTAIVVFMLILAACPGTISDKWPTALTYTVFDAVCIFFLRVLEYEKEEKSETLERKMLDRLQEAEELLQEAMEIIKKGDQDNGCK